MNETEGMRRFVEATERIAKALERMAEQQAEFLATMPAEDITDGMTVTPWPPTPDSMDAALDDMAGVVASQWPAHDYSDACACPMCWAERRRRKR